MHENHGNSLPRRALAGATRFACLASGLFVVILLLAAAEGLVLWRAGFRYVPKSSVRQVSVTGFSISADTQRAASLVAITPNSFRDPRRVDVVLHDLPDQGVVRLHVEDLHPQCVAMSPTAADVVIAGLDGSVYAWSGSATHAANGRVRGEGLRLIGRTEPSLHRLVFSPDGRLLAGAGGRFVYLWRWPDAELLQQRPHGGGGFPCLSFSADSRTLLSRGPALELCLWDALSGETIKTIPTGGLQVIEAVLSPDGQLCAMVDDFWNVRAYHLTRGQELWRRAAASRAPSIAFSADGRLLSCIAVESDFRQINVYDAFRGDYLYHLANPAAALVGMRLASDGMLYTWDMGGAIRAWDVPARKERWRFSVAERAARETE